MLPTTPSSLAYFQIWRLTLYRRIRLLMFIKEVYFCDDALCGSWLLLSHTSVDSFKKVLVSGNSQSCNHHISFSRLVVTCGTINSRDTVYIKKGNSSTPLNLQVCCCRSSYYPFFVSAIIQCFTLTCTVISRFGGGATNRLNTLSCLFL